MVRQARTTGSTCHHFKSHEVKDVPEGGGASRDDQPVVMTNYVESDVLGNMNIYGTDMEFNDHDDERFDERNAHDEIDSMIVDVEMTKYDTEDSLDVDEGRQDGEDGNFDEKVCKELNEMGIMDIQPDELRNWMSLRCGDDDGDGVKDKSGIEDEMYENGTWM